MIREKNRAGAAKAEWLRPHDLVLFQGDSITDAFRKPDEVGINYQLGAGYAMIVAARLLAERPGDGLRFENRGVSGNTLAGLAARWETDCLALQPTVLSILVGVNDVMHTIAPAAAGKPPTPFADAYHELLVTTRRRLPDIRLILCEPFLLPFPGRLNAGPKQQFTLPPITAAQVEDLRSRQATVRRLAAEFGALFVPLQKRFEQAAARTGVDPWLFDGVHPNAAGQWLIAAAWLKAVRAGKVG
jgi:lysophospholipase L1-like esterase